LEESFVLICSQHEFRAAHHHLMLDV